MPRLVSTLGSTLRYPDGNCKYAPNHHWLGIWTSWLWSLIAEECPVLRGVGVTLLEQERVMSGPIQHDG